VKRHDYQGQGEIDYPYVIFSFAGGMGGDDPNRVKDMPGEDSTQAATQISR
jgi:hypothetical protein